MAFYSTYPFDHIVGPGIGRGEYGGFLMSLPARRMFDVWRDTDYDIAEASRSAAAGRARLFGTEICRVCGGQAAALDLPQHRHAVRDGRSSTFPSATCRRLR
jgi:hypothetical protein